MEVKWLSSRSGWAEALPGEARMLDREDGGVGGAYKRLMLRQEGERFLVFDPVSAGCFELDEQAARIVLGLQDGLGIADCARRTGASESEIRDLLSAFEQTARFENQTERPSEPHRLGVLVLKPGCTCRCLFCNPPAVNHRSLDYAESLEVACENLERFLDEGVKTIRISGNDPLETEESVLLSIIERAAQRARVEIATNGVRCADASFLRRLIDAGVGGFEIPIYGASERTHQFAIHGSPLDRLLESFGRIVDFGARLVTLTGVNKVNVGEIERIFEAVIRAVGTGIDLLSRMEVTVLYIPYEGYPGLEEWHLPFGELQPHFPALLDRIENDSRLAPRVLFVGFPYCAFARKSRITLNPFNEEYLHGEYKSRVGSYKPAAAARSKADPSIPAYRLQLNPEELCSGCAYLGQCGGIPVFDYRLNGTGKLKKLENLSGA